MEVDAAWNIIAAYSRDRTLPKEIPDRLALLYCAVEEGLLHDKIKPALSCLKRFTDRASLQWEVSETVVELSLDLIDTAFRHNQGAVVSSFVEQLVEWLKKREIHPLETQRFLRLLRHTNDPNHLALLVTWPGLLVSCSRSLILRLLQAVTNHDINLALTIFNHAKNHFVSDCEISLILIDIHLSSPEIFTISSIELLDMAEILDSRLKYRIAMILISRDLDAEGLALLEFGLIGCVGKPPQLAQIYVTASRLGHLGLASRSFQYLLNEPYINLEDLEVMAEYVCTEQRYMWCTLLELYLKKVSASEKRNRAFVLLLEARLELKEFTKALDILSNLGEKLFPKNLSSRYYMPLIEACLEKNHVTEAEHLFQQLPVKTESQETHFRVLKIRAARRNSQQNQRKDLITSAPSFCLSLETFLLEKSWVLLENRDWHGLLMLLEDKDFAEPGLSALQLVAFVQMGSFELARERFHLTLLTPSLPDQSANIVLLQEAVAECSLYVFSLSAQWDYVNNILNHLPFKEKSPGFITFYYQLSQIYCCDEQKSIQGDMTIYHLEQAIGLARNSKELELLIGINERLFTIENQDFDKGRRHELCAYFRFLAAAFLEEPLAAIKTSHRRDWENIHAHLPKAQPREILAFISRCQSLR